MAVAETSPSWIVCKFGGTSVATADNWTRIADIIRDHQKKNRRVLLVCSAAAGVSDALEQLLIQDSNKTHDEYIEAIRTRYLELAKDLSCDGEALLAPHFEALTKLTQGIQLVGEVSPRTHAKVMAFGEIMLTTLACQFLQDQGIAISYFDAREGLQTTADSHYLQAQCDDDFNQALAGKLDALNTPVVITQGFIAANKKGETMLLGRGGSDVSAAYFSAQINAEICQIWTDVLGIYTTNPHQIPQARLLTQLDYDEAQEIASMGAKVLHPRSIGPLKKRNIAIHVKDTQHPERSGTVITHHSDKQGLQIKSIIAKLSIVLITIETVHMWKRVGFLADIFTCFKNHGLSVDLLSTSETNITVSLDHEYYQHDEERIEHLLADLNKIAEARVIGPCASLSLIGKNIRMILPDLGEAFAVFANQQIFMLSQAANDLNLTFVIDERQVDKLAKKLHSVLIEQNPKNYSLGPTWLEVYGEIAPRLPSWWEGKREQLLALASDAPAYVYDKQAVQHAIGQIKKCDAVSRVFYAMKANPFPAILQEVVDSGIGIECVSLAEIEWAKQHCANLTNDNILFTPNFASKDEFKKVLELGVHITLDNLYILEHWGKMFSGKNIILRIDPGYGRGHHKHVLTGGNDSKFGIPRPQLERVHELINKHNITVKGLHAHTGSGILQAESWQDTANQLVELLEEFSDVSILNLGGGLGIVERPGQVPLDLDVVNQSLHAIKQRFPNQELWLEPGRFLVARCGVLLARVTQTKSKGTTHFVGIETGMNSLIRPSLYGSYHEIVNLTRLNDVKDQICHVVGPICETGDTLGYSRALPATKEGDVMLIANAGAYGHCMSSNYNLRAPAKEIFFED